MNRGLLNDDLAENLLSWRNSGFSIDNSVKIFDDQTRENLAEYMARPPLRRAYRRPAGCPIVVFGVLCVPLQHVYHSGPNCHSMRSTIHPVVPRW